MQAWKIIAAIVGTLALFCSAAQGQSLVVEMWHGTTMDSQNTYTPSPNPTSPVSFTIPIISTTDRINIYSTGGLASIGTISFSGSTSASSVDVVIGSGPLNDNPDANPDNAAQNWGGVSFPFSARLSGAIAGNLTGSINPTSIVRLEIHGTASASITASASTGTAIGLIQVGSTSSAATISASNSASNTAIRAIQAESTGTSLAGVISAPNGGIGNIVAAGDIVIAANPGIAAKSGIVSIQAGSIDAHVAANAFGGNGDLGMLDIAGDFNGSLDANVLNNSVGETRVRIEGASRAPIAFAGDIYGPIEVHGCFDYAGECRPTAGRRRDDRGLDRVPQRLRGRPSLRGCR